VVEFVFYSPKTTTNFLFRKEVVNKSCSTGLNLLD